MRIDVATSTGPAWVDLDEPPAAWAGLVLGHGAGGTIDAPDLAAVTAAAVTAGVAVARVTQPYRVAGRRAPAPAPRLDEAWREVLADLAPRAPWRDLPIIYGGRSSGARVACRCAAGAGPAGAGTAGAGTAGAAAVGVVALAFPTHPPGRPDRSREDELRAVAVPLLVVQGERDAFGQPGAELFDGRDRILRVVPGADHALRRDVTVTACAVVDFLRRFQAV